MAVDPQLQTLLDMFAAAGAPPMETMDPAAMRPTSSSNPEHAGELGGRADRLAVGGDSAGGNLAAVMTLLTQRRNGPALTFQLLVYPATDAAMTHASVETNGEGYMLTRSSMVWFMNHYLGA